MGVFSGLSCFHTLPTGRDFHFRNSSGSTKVAEAVAFLGPSSGPVGVDLRGGVFPVDGGVVFSSRSTWCGRTRSNAC